MDTLDEDGAEVQMQVEPVDTLTMLGANISSKGFTSESVDHRAAKATGAFWKHSFQDVVFQVWTFEEKV